MKKIIAFLLAAMMLVSLAACDNNDSKLPVGDDDSDSVASDTKDAEDDTKSADDTEADDTEAEEIVYEPDLDAKYSGMVGVAVESGTAYFDNLKVTSKQSNKLQLSYNDMEDGAVPTFVYSNGDVAVSTDPLAEEDDEEIGKVLSGAAGSMAYLGSSEWNYYQYAVKVLPTDDDTAINIIFCVKDEKNYYVLSLGESGNSQADCYEVKDGVKTSVAEKVLVTLPLDSWSNIGITVDREVIGIYVNGKQKFSLFDEEWVYSKSIAPTASVVNAPYCSSWESWAGLNDGDVPKLTNGGSGAHYGSWSMAQTSETISYEWDEAVTVDGIGLFFWHDTASREVWLSSGGINSPASYTVQYLNEDGEYVDVTNGSGYEVLDDTMNQTFFDAVTTTSIQITMYKFTADEDAQYGFSAYADYDGEETAEDAPTDPSTRGLGLFEFEVYAAGTVTRPN